MKITFLSIPLAIGLLLAAFLLTGCATQSGIPSHQYLQRPLSVAIVPGLNKTDQPEANIVLDKAWEAALARLGYQVVSADHVVTYASASGLSLEQVRKTAPAKLGQDLKVDAILQTEVLRWNTSYKVIAADSTVAGVGRLIEASTGAIIWEHHWVFQNKSGNGGNNGILGLLIDAAVTATINSATDAPTRMAKQAVNMSAGTLPHPGNAPEAKPPL
jgi:hypothetical protein